MFAWQRNLKLIIRHAGFGVRTDLHLSASISSSADSSPVLGKSCYRQNVWKSPSVILSRPPYHYLQQSDLSSSRELQVMDSRKAPVPYLLMSGSSAKKDSANKGKTKIPAKKNHIRPFAVRTALKHIKQSPIKVNYIARFIRYMLLEDAFVQLEFCPKKAARFAHSALRMARHNVIHNYRWDPSRLIIHEINVAPGRCTKEISYHGKGYHGTIVHRQCHLNVSLREISAEEELKIARLRVDRYRNFKYMRFRDKQLVPHQIIESNPKWGEGPFQRPRPRKTGWHHKGEFEK